MALNTPLIKSYKFDTLLTCCMLHGFGIRSILCNCWLCIFIAANCYDSTIINIDYRLLSLSGWLLPISYHYYYSYSISMYHTSYSHHAIIHSLHGQWHDGCPCYHHAIRCTMLIYVASRHIVAAVAPPVRVSICVVVISS